MKRCVILICHGNGFGDQYNSLMVSHTVMKDLESMGYKVDVGYICWHSYFSNNISMDELFDYSLFEKDVIFLQQPPSFREHDYLKGLVEYPKDGYNFVLFGELNDNYLSNYIPSIGQISITDYKFKYSILGRDKSWVEKSFFEKDILKAIDEKISNQFGNSEFYAIHVRCEDILSHYSFEELMEISPFWKTAVENVEDKINKELPNDNIMLCSQNPSIAEYFKNKYKNVYCNQFTHTNLKRHNCYWDGTIPDNVYIEHAKETLIEMGMMYKAKKIGSVNTFPSNFILYGLAHNIHHSEPELYGESLLF